MIFSWSVVYGDPGAGRKAADRFEGAWSKFAKGVDDTEKVK
jgi:hypothetical protein